MIVHDEIQSIRPSRIVYADPMTVRRIVETMLISMAEANTEMVCDNMDNDEQTRSGIEGVFLDLKAQALDMVDDVFDTLRESVREQIQRIEYTAKVRGLEYDDKGELEDVKVEIKFK